jgi:methionyl-tRNA formyltransferase
MDIIAISNNLYDNTSLFKKDNVFYIKNKLDLTYTNLVQYHPEYVFFPHWSYIIDKEIYENFNCIIFHMTNLPFGRGGSPLQNLLERKIYKTKISAIKCAQGVDTGDIYLQCDFDISYGNAENIYLRASEIVSEMIDEIIMTNPKPKPQSGTVVSFKRRDASQSNIFTLDDLESVYNYIRMLDAPGYPRAFIKNNFIKYEFFNVEKINNTLQAQVEIRLENDE